MSIKIESNKAIAVAVSGGSDSMALLLKAKEMGNKIYALTVDHNLREGSKVEALQVQEWCRQLGIEHHILTWEHEGILSNIQEQARDARYKLLSDFCTKHNIEYLLLGHNMEDVAENFMIRLDRGSGIDGLAAISEISTKSRITLLRPLLHSTKEELKQYLLSKKQSWIEDPSNKNEKYTRVKFRKLLTEMGSLFTKRVADAAFHLERTKVFLENYTNQIFADLGIFHPEAYVELDFLKLTALEDEILYRIISKSLMLASGKNYKARFEGFSKLIEKIKADEDFIITLHGSKIKKNKNQLLFTRQKEKYIKPQKLLKGENIWDDRFIIEYLGDRDDLYIDYLDPIFWGKIREKITYKKLDKDVLFSLPVIRTIDEIIAIPHLQSENMLFKLKLR